MWWQVVDRRRAGVAAALAAAGAVVLALGATTSGGGAHGPGSAASSVPARLRAPGSVPVLTSVPPTTAGVVGDGSAAAEQQPHDLQAAREVATAFAVGYSAYRWDEHPSAPLDRVRHLLTEEVVTELARSSGRSAERERAAARREIAVPSVDAVLTQVVGAGYLELDAVVRERVTTSSGTLERSFVYQLALERRAERWVIVRVMVA